ncbi:MAG: hypothetical protein Q9M27_05350 [Mariprofundaceae bacterium]|nr:hypothetical protein [Mariprofundaceae bacterium]
MMKSTFVAALTAPILLLSACASLAAGESSGIGPYHRVTARILVMEPKHIWQAIVNWQSERPDEGKMRIVHAVSGRIVEFSWQHDEMWLRDNQVESPKWRLVSKEELASRGMVISPRELSEFLGGHVPPGFQPKGLNRWTIHRNNSHVRVEWNAQKKRLIFSDIRHGRKATMFILKSSPPPTPRV